MERSYITTFDDLQADVAVWSARNFPNNKPYHPLLGVSEEVGELCHAHLKDEQGIRGIHEVHRAAKIDAVGDIIIYLADYCARNGLDLGYAVGITWNKVCQRDWTQNKVTGRSPSETEQPHEC